MVYRVIYIGIECQIIIDPHYTEDSCYALFRTLSDQCSMVSVDKPSCSRAIAYGENFEIRLFIRSTTGEALLIITVNSANNTLKEDSVTAFELFNKVFGALSRYILYLRKIRIYIRSSLRFPIHRIRNIITGLQSIGIALTKTELKNLEGSHIYMITGLYIEQHLRSYEINIVAFIRDSPIAEASTTITSYTNKDKIFEDLLSLIGTTRAILEVIEDLASSSGSNP